MDSPPDVYEKFLLEKTLEISIGGSRKLRKLVGVNRFGSSSAKRELFSLQNLIALCCYSERILSFDFLEINTIVCCVLYCVYTSAYHVSYIHFNLIFFSFSYFHRNKIS